MNNNYSDYIVYVDESGDHGMSNINNKYPIFVLVFCIFKKTDYLKIANKIQKFKFNHFGHDMVVLHESEIRRDRGDFKQLSKEQKQIFMNELSSIIKDNNFTVIASVIDKLNMRVKYSTVRNPYYVATGFCLERLKFFLEEREMLNKEIQIIFEKRGSKEDSDLELNFRRWCSGDNYFQQKFNFNIRMVNKQINSAGLQIADLIARPIGLSVLRPKQDNQAFEIVKDKFRKYKGFYKKAGLKVFPDE